MRAILVAVLLCATPAYGQFMRGWNDAERDRQELEAARIQNEAARIELEKLRLEGQASPPSKAWQNATNIGTEPTGDAMLSRCIYETLGGYRFTIISRGLCPFQVKINPETNQVLR